MGFSGGVCLSTWIPSIYLLRTNPLLLQRRMRGGPAAETRTVQKVVIAGLVLVVGSNGRGQRP